MKTIETYHHKVASHCETGSVRNLLNHAGIEISEPMVFGIGSGPAFYYLFFARGPSGFPLVGIRNPPGSILRNTKKLCGYNFCYKKYKTTDQAIEKANQLIDSDIPVAVTIDMFYMKYLPSFLRVHAPFHFIILVGREGDSYAVSDPYHNEIGILKEEDLRAAWETHAPLAKDNFLAYLDGSPSQIDLKGPVQKAILKTCNNILLPPGIKNLFWFVGIQGIKTYAKKILLWPKEYKGVVLREGILFNAVGFEDQGTGGGAFRLMYGAFLQEVSQMFKSQEMDDLAIQMIEHGNCWRNISRKIIKVGKTIPIDNDEYPDWYDKNKDVLKDGLSEISNDFLDRALFEEQFFNNLRKAAKRLS